VNAPARRNAASIFGKSRFGHGRLVSVPVASPGAVFPHGVGALIESDLPLPIKPKRPGAGGFIDVSVKRHSQWQRSSAWSYPLQ
jgi:hypothetical protein